MAANDMVPLLGVDNLKESLVFYTNGLGFEMTQDWHHEGELRWCRLQLDGVGIMLQQFGAPGRLKGIGMSLCIFCDDAVELYRRFVSNGVEAKEPFVGNGLWVTSVKDPDGYSLDFESATDVAEETTLSEFESR